MLGDVATETSHSSPEPPKCLAFPAQRRGSCLPCPGWETPSRSVIFLSASRGQGHFSSKKQPGRKGPAGPPSGPALRVSAASQRPCWRPRPSPCSSAYPGVRAPSPSVKMSKSKGCPPPRGPCQDLAARPPVCLQPRTVPGPLGLPQQTRRVGLLSVCRWMTSTSRTHSSAHPLTHCPSSTQLLIRTFAPSPLTASLIHAAYQARLGSPVRTLSEAPPLTPATYSTVTSILHRFQPAWRGCPRRYLTSGLATPSCFLPRAFLSPRVGSHKDPRGTLTCATNKGGSIRAQEAPFGRWNTEATG